ncbi:GNAT family N-acetyltransferase [Streptomyces fuscigenes]|uniref:GNAT family N-acetyltransferase n=1 Tax=Streptomyces fuscigenes TaxID=1528880 RepID=UPI001F4707BA|nr:GNAT family N-acetyltransferase [Streptomyces fuscigenes]MCF3964377.1 acetyltransferase [Streptomyces fuscigenes]
MTDPAHLPATSAPVGGPHAAADPSPYAVRFGRTDPSLGTFSVRGVDPLADTALLHRWVTHPKASFWLMQGASLTDVEREYMAIAAAEHHDAFLGLHDGAPAFLIERYDPAFVELKGLYDAQPGDIGMHFLVDPAPSGGPLHGFTRAVLTTVMAFLFEDASVRRVVVEPDVRNTAVHALNEAVGFQVVEKIAKPEKEALLSVCTREAFEAATEGGAR